MKPTIKTIILFVLFLFFISAFWPSAPAAASPSNFSITVNKNGDGNVTLNPNKPDYAPGENVILTAAPAAGWTFSNWQINHPAWWNNQWEYRLPFSIDADGYARTDLVAEIGVNLTDLLGELGVSGTVNLDSLRLVEINNTGSVLDAAVPFQFDKVGSFDPVLNARGELIFQMTGSTAANATRYYDLYFDTDNGPFPPLNFTPQVTVTTANDAGQESFQITTAAATYFYQKQAGGFSSLLDADGNDWISFDPTVGSGSAGEFRGIPNLMHPSAGGHFHPGKTTAVSVLESAGPLRATIYSSAPGTNWSTRWKIYPQFAFMRVETIDTPKYWFLYEGTPGGVLDLASDFVVRSDGTQNLANTSWTGDISADEWVYIADPVVGRSIFVTHKPYDELPDTYFPKDGLMTVLGIGRSGNTPQLSTAGDRFLVGLVDATAYNDVKPIINAAYKSMEVSVGDPQARAGTAYTQNPMTVTVTGNMVVTANFEPAVYTLTLSSIGDGQVNANPNQATYPHGTNVTLTAVPNPGWKFVNWQGGLSGAQNPTAITMTANTNIQAKFEPETYTLDTSVVGQGAVNLSPDLPAYAYNQQVTLTAVPATGWQFTSWGGDLSGTNPVQTKTITADTAVTANFTAIPYTLTWDVTGQGNVQVDPFQNSYFYGDEVTVTAVPISGWFFDSWSGALSAMDNPATLIVTGNMTFGASFVTNQTPILETIPNQQGYVNQTISFVAQAADPDGIIPALSAANLPEGATFVDNGDGSALFNWSTNSNDVGEYSITVTASDGEKSDSQVVAIVVTPYRTALPIILAWP